MKTFTRWLLTLALAAFPMMAVVNTASANSELVPASRLVAPLYDISGGRNTFFLLTNTSVFRLNGFVPGSVGAVHVQFYDKTCAPGSTVVNLSEHDIDQLNVTAGIVAAGSTQGFADIDVRVNPADVANSTSIQMNGLLGEVVIVDPAGDWALSYPMASVVGSSRLGGGLGGAIVTRQITGLPLAWTGRYDPLPNRLFLPGFYAEGGAPAAAGSIGASFLSIVSPADGNWYGSRLPADTNIGEAPGQPLAAPLPAGQWLVNLIGIHVWDGCEHQLDRQQQGHTVMGSLGTLFGPALNRGFPWATGAGCSPVAFPTNDDANITVPVGWIDLPSNSRVLSATTAFHPLADQAAGNPLRTLAGVFFETTNVNAATITAADTARLWGSRVGLDPGLVICRDSAGAPTFGLPVTGCKYAVESVLGVPPTEP